jgi:hypothetical protein
MFTGVLVLAKVAVSKISFLAVSCDIPLIDSPWLLSAIPIPPLVIASIEFLTSRRDDSRFREKENSESRRERDEEEGDIPGRNGESLRSVIKRVRITLQSLLAGKLAGTRVSGPGLITRSERSSGASGDSAPEQSVTLLARIFAGDDEAAALCYVSETMNGV